METRILYFNSISTGCSCCRNENFCEGPYETLEEARESARYHHRNKTLASQFASNGCQETYQTKCRIIPNPEDEDSPIILIPGGLWTEGFGGRPLPADAYYYMEEIK